MGHYVHHVPGRLRVRCSSLRACIGKQKAVSDALKGQMGVRQVEFRKHAGSITIHYNVDGVSFEELMTILRANGCAEGAALPKKAKKAKPRKSANAHANLLSSKAFGETVTKTVVGAVVGTLVRHTVEPPVVALLRGAGVTR